MKVLWNSIARNSTPDSTNTLLKIAETYSKCYPDDKVEFIVSDKEMNNPGQKVNGIEIVILKHSYSPVLKNILTERRIHSEITRLKPDVVLTYHPLKITSDYRQIFFASHPINGLLREKESVSEKLKNELWYDIENSDSVVVFSEPEKHLITTLFTGIWEKINVIHRLSATGNKPVTSDERQKIKDTIAEGNEFFLCPFAKDEDIVVNVLKGFSGFKKWQRSNMKLILVPFEKEQEDNLNSLISSYRFKEDISIISSDHPELSGCIAAAYAVLLPDKYDTDMGFAIKCIEAEVPLIIPTGSVYSEVVKNNGFQFIYQNKDDITRVMLESFREEAKRSRLIQSSKDILSRVSQESFCTALRKLFTEN